VPSVLQRMDNAEERQLAELFGRRLFGNPESVKPLGMGKAGADVAAHNRYNLWLADAKGRGNVWTSSDNAAKEGNVPCKQLKLTLDKFKGTTIVAFSSDKRSECSIEEYLVVHGRERGYDALLLGTTGLGDLQDCLLAITVEGRSVLGKDTTYFPMTCQQICRGLNRESPVQRFNQGDSLRDLWRESPRIAIDLEERLTLRLRETAWIFGRDKFKLNPDQSVRLIPVIDVAPYFSNPDQLFRVEGHPARQDELKEKTEGQIDGEVEKWLQALERQNLVWLGKEATTADSLQDDEVESVKSLRLAFTEGTLSKLQIKELVEDWVPGWQV
jgi:hypothetical protein